MNRFILKTLEILKKIMTYVLFPEKVGKNKRSFIDEETDRCLAKYYTIKNINGWRILTPKKELTQFDHDQINADFNKINEDTKKVSVIFY
jgi:hypothetical protein